MLHLPYWKSAPACTTLAWESLGIPQLQLAAFGLRVPQVVLVVLMVPTTHPLPSKIPLSDRVLPLLGRGWGVGRA